MVQGEVKIPLELYHELLEKADHGMRLAEEIRVQSQIFLGETEKLIEFLYETRGVAEVLVEFNKQSRGMHIDIDDERAQKIKLILKDVK